MVDPHTELKNASRWKRFVAWYKHLSRRSKIFAISSSVLFILTIIASIVLVILTVQSLTKDDLALYLTINPSTLAVETGNEGTLTITASAKNLPFCTARCTYTVTDQLTGGVIHEGSVTLRTGIDSSTPFSYQAPASFERDGLVTVAFVCANTPTTLCRSEGNSRYAAATTRVISRYTDEQRAARDSFVQAYTERSERIAQTIGLVDALARSTDVRAEALSRQAQTEAEAITTTLAQAQEALQREAFSVATSILASIEEPEAVALYEQLRTDESAAVALYEELATTTAAFSRLTPLLDTTNAAIVAQLRTELARIGANFTTTPLRATQTQLETVRRTTTAITPESITLVNTTLAPFETMLRRDESLRCALYGNERINCPPSTPSLEQTTLLALVARTEAYCALANTTQQRFADSRLAYARTVLDNETLSLAEALIMLDVDTITTNESYASWRAVTIEELLNGTNSSLSPAEVLALNPQPQTITEGITCTLPQPTLLPSLAPSLPELQAFPAELPPLTTTPRQCCDNGLCVACPAEQRTPVVFVHGFSFSQGTTPETNLNAFGALAHWLDERNSARYLGHVFPQQFAAQGTSASATGLPGRYSMTATYYYDSFSEDGSLSLVTRKTENLETYAIRLREAIAVARARTGQDQVVIVAHSMGGLVTRRYLQLFGEDSVAAVIMIGTPNNGITGRTQQFCGVIGSELECRDMERGSVFMQKLNAEAPPTLPVFTIVGTGCDTSGEDGDGIITAESVRLSWATNVPVQGLCDGRAVLHGTLLEPTVHRDVAETVEGLINRY